MQLLAKFKKILYMGFRATLKLTDHLKLLIIRKFIFLAVVLMELRIYLAC